jgi:hypothetical protein
MISRIAFVLFLSALSLGGCSRPPQIVDSEECLAATDALWTAVTSKRNELLVQADRQIQQLHQQATLGDQAFNELQSIVSQARAGQWDDAVKDLKWFIKGQRRK